MSTPTPTPTATPVDEGRRGSVALAYARAQAFAWGFQHAHTTTGTRHSAEFAAAYAGMVAEFRTGDRTILVPIPDAWSAWRAGRDLTDPAVPLTPRPDTSQVPDYDTARTALRDPSAQQMVFECLGYARGWCDAHGLGAGTAIDFARTFAVLVAGHRSRPNIAEAWLNWIHGRPVEQFAHHEHTHTA